jgi:hypothetical protein
MGRRWPQRRLMPEDARVGMSQIILILDQAQMIPILLVWPFRLIIIE